VCIQEQCGVPTPQEDLFENNDTPANASPITDGTHNALTIHSIDPDFYAITIPANQSLTVRYLAQASNATLHGQLIDPVSGFVRDARLARSHFGTLYAEASEEEQAIILSVGNPHGQVLTYQIIVEFSFGSTCMRDVGDAPFFGNNTLETAEHIASRHWATFARSICGSDKDWYRVDIGAGDDLIALLWSEPGQTKPLFSLRDDQGEIIQVPEATGTHQTVHGVELEPGAYFLAVEPNVGVMSVRYQLQIDRWNSDQCTPDLHEVDDLPELGASKTLLPPVLTLCGDDVDYIPVSNNPGEGLSINLVYNNFFAVLRATLIDSESGDELQEISGTSLPLEDDQTLLIQTAPSDTSQDYLVKVERISGNPSVLQAWYTLSVEPLLINCLDDASEDNDSWMTATPTTIFGASVQANSLAFCAGDAADWYQSTLEPTDTITIDVIKESTDPATFNIALHKPVATGLLSSTPQVSEDLGTSLSHTLDNSLSTGDYLWKISADQSSPYILYAVRVRGQDCSSDPEEPDNTPLSGRLLSPGGNLAGTLCVNNPDVIRIDYDGSNAGAITVTGSSNLIVKIGVTVLDSSLDPVMGEILQGVGTQNLELDPSTIGLTAGTYFIILQPLLGSTYTVTW
jgi:hypothetical protein